MSYTGSERALRVKTRCVAPRKRLENIPGVYAAGVGVGSWNTGSPGETKMVLESLTQRPVPPAPRPPAPRPLSPSMHLEYTSTSEDMCTGAGDKSR